MKNHQRLLIVFVLLGVAASVLVEAQRESTTAAIIRSRGYIAQDYQLEVQDGKYTLSLVRALNPLINNGTSGLPGKDPILFIHGIILNANCFIYNNKGVRPMDHSDRDIGSMSAVELEILLRSDPGSQSLVFTVLNFGYEVWLLNRRSTVDSRAAHFARTGGVDGISNEALYDFPATVSFVLEKTGKDKLLLVTHSAGGAITLMALTNMPELAAKISKGLLWAPVLDYKGGFEGGMFNPLVDSILIASLPIISQIMAPLPPSAFVPLVQGLVKFGCDTDVLRSVLCYPIANFILGIGSSQLMIENLSPQNQWLGTLHIPEEVQLIQAMKKTFMHRYDYFDIGRNLKAYGQLQPPKYNTTRIQLETLSFWYGNTDGLARAPNYELITSRLTVPVKKHFIGGLGITFNHLGFLLHKDVTRLLIVPSLKTIGSA